MPIWLTSSNGTEMPLASRGKIARVILQVLDLTRLSGKSGRIFVPERPLCLADDAVRSSPELIAAVDDSRACDDRLRSNRPRRAHDGDGMAGRTALRLLLTGGDVLAPRASRSATLRRCQQLWTHGMHRGCHILVLKPGSHGAPPIGRPIAGASVYLLDEHGEPVPDGSWARFTSAAAGVGRGYRNLPDSTERSFLPDPFAGAPGARMYRTGDRGVRRPDGEIEFRGRLDRQTKIRGQRVELDEIASILAQHPSIDFATAIANIAEGGENQLVAYVLPKEECACSHRTNSRSICCAACQTT
jgi:acyl-CoA synthetase (AMP-forming)/AMP-acid ligase II